MHGHLYKITQVAEIRKKKYEPLLHEYFTTKQSICKTLYKKKVFNSNWDLTFLNRQKKRVMWAIKNLEQFALNGTAYNVSRPKF